MTHHEDESRDQRGVLRGLPGVQVGGRCIVAEVGRGGVSVRTVADLEAVAQAANPLAA